TDRGEPETDTCPGSAGVARAGDRPGRRLGRRAVRPIHSTIASHSPARFGQPNGRSLAGSGQRLTSNGDRCRKTVRALAALVMPQKKKKPTVYAGTRATSTGTPKICRLSGSKIAKNSSSATQATRNAGQRTHSRRCANVFSIVVSP